MIDRSNWRYFDVPLFIAVILLTIIGISMIYSATATTIDLSNYWARQLIFASLGLIVMVAIAALDYRQLEILAPVGFAVFVIVLGVVLLAGTEQGGSRRWIGVGGTLVQPTEAGKFMLIVFMAWYLSWFHNRMEKLAYMIGAIAVLVIPLLLVYLQPDLGMTITYAFLGGLLILIGGIRLWQVGVLVVGTLALLPLLGRTLQGYMIERLQVFLDPGANPDAAFNINQALIAVGSGGWMGRGWGHGSQNQLHFLRVRHTDFIYSVIAEELGLVGAVMVLALLFFVVWRLLRIADLARDHFGRLIAAGVAALVFFQVLVNVGMNLSLVPVTGLTLPFVSYGGSSLISMMFAIGLAQSVIMRHRRIEFF